MSRILGFLGVFGAPIAGALLFLALGGGVVLLEIGGAVAVWLGFCWLVCSAFSEL